LNSGFSIPCSPFPISAVAPEDSRNPLIVEIRFATYFRERGRGFDNASRAISPPFKMLRSRAGEVLPSLKVLQK
jgi:hypothetical protein